MDIMASTVSYANVAATGTASKTDSQTPEFEAAVESSATSSAPASSPAPAAESAESSELADSTKAPSSPAAEAASKKEKKVLAPAPVPSKSAWGAAAASEQSPAHGSVDEHKWPTPDKVSQIEQSQPSKATKFIKPNKWVPINAKVVLPSTRSSHAQGSGPNNQQKNKRKNKTQKKKTPASPTSDDSIIKRDESDKLDSESSADVTQSAEFDQPAGESTDGSQQHANGQLHNYNYQNDGYQRLRYNNGQNAANQKNFKRFTQNGNPAQQGGKPAQHQLPRPGYYQQFVPSQYQNYGGNRQYKSTGGANGGQYRRSSSNGNIHNGYANGYNMMGGSYIPHIPHHPQAMMGVPFGGPVPVQIPPPISPKQNPQQALTQQIDYYFSLENLIRDVFLRKNMGTEGWVELDLVLNFKRIKIIVNGIHNAIEETDEEKKAQELDASILRAVQQCQNVEIGYLNGKDDDNATATEVQLRVKNSFEQWLLPDN